MKTPFPYQSEVISEIDGFDGRVLCALDMGLGKTPIALWWVLRHRAKAAPALVICQANMKYQWEIEASELGLTTAICEGQTPPRNRSFMDGADVTIINYDILRFWVEHLRGLRCKTVIVDECQNLANAYTKRTKAAKAVVRGIPNMLALSGTPLLNRPIELFPILQMLWPDQYKSQWSYAQSYCNPRWTPWGWNYDGASNLDKLHAELKSHGMIRRRKQDVLKDLPDKVRQIIPCPVSDMHEYIQARDDFKNWLRRNMAHRVRSASKMEKMAQVGYLLRLTARLKFRGVVEWANNFLENTDEKLILFAVHQKMIEALERRVNGKAIRIDGSVTGRARQYAKDQFQNDPSTRLALCSLAGSTGITLTAASTVGFCEFFWRPGDHSQAEDRPHRIGQKNTVWINYLVALGTIEERLCKILQKKQETISTVLDGGKMPTDLNLYDELLTQMESEIGGFDVDSASR